MWFISIYINWFETEILLNNPISNIRHDLEQKRKKLIKRKRVINSDFNDFKKYISNLDLNNRSVVILDNKKAN